MSDRTAHICSLTALVLEARSSLMSVGIDAGVAEIIEFARLVQLRESEVRRMEFMARERLLTYERRPDDQAVN